VNGAGQGLLSHHGNLTNGLEWASLGGGTWTANGFFNPSANDSVPQAIRRSARTGPD
jgi:hypothetical protein